MKKIIAVSLALFLGFAAYAQDENDLKIASNDKGYLTMLDYFGWGFHAPHGEIDGFTTFGRSREFFFNILELGTNLTPGITASVGVDAHWDSFRLTKDKYYWVPVDQSVSMASKEFSDFSKIKKSVLRVFSFDIPLDFTYKSGDLKFTLGASAELNFSGRTKFKGVYHDGSKLKNGYMRIKDVKTDPITFNAHAMVSYHGVGLFFKYSPNSPFKEYYGPQFTCYTFGIIFR